MFFLFIKSKLECESIGNTCCYGKEIKVCCHNVEEKQKGLFFLFTHLHYLCI